MSSNKLNSQLSAISKKLDTLIRLLSLNLIKDIKIQKEQITILSDAGFQPRQIANILNTTSNTVSVTLHDIRKERVAKESKETPSQEEKAEAKPESQKN